MPVVRFLLVCSVLSFIPYCCSAQIFEWIDTYETEGNYSWLSDIVVDNNGNVYVSGIFRGSTKIQGTLISNLTRNADSYIAKYNASGNLLWLKHLNASSQLSLHDMTLAKNGNILATGMYQGNLSIDGHSMTTISSVFDFGNTFVFEFSPNGNLVAASDVGIAETNLADVGYAIDTDATGNIYLAGSTGKRMLFKKLNSNRNLIWSKTYGFSSNVGSVSAGTITVDDSGTIYSSGIESGSSVLIRISPTGGTDWVQKDFGYIQSIQVDKNNDLIVCGRTLKDALLGKQVMDTTGGLIAKIDASGRMVWKHIIPGYNGSELDIDTHNDIYVTGAITSNVQFDPFDIELEGVSNIVLKSLSSNGTFRWVSKVGEKYEGDFGDIIETDNDGNIYIGNQIKKDSLAKFQCVEQRGNSRMDKFVAKIVPFKTVPINGPSDLCVNSEAEIQFTSISDYITYQWHFSGSNLTTTTVNNTTVRLKSSTPGIVTASIITAVDLGCEIFKINHSLPITIKSGPTSAIISGKNAVCAGELNVEYSVLEPDDDLSEWTSPANALVVSHDNSRLILSFSSAFVEGEILMKKTNLCGSVSSAPLNVKALPIVGPAEAINGPQEVCANVTNIKFDTPVILNAERYIWTLSSNLSNSTALISSLPEIGVNFGSMSGEGTLKVMGQNKCGVGLESEIYKINIKSKPDIPSQISGLNAVCAETSAVYRISEMDNVDSFLWTYRSLAGNVIKSFQAQDLDFNIVLYESGMVQVSASNTCGTSALRENFVNVIIRDKNVPEIEKTCNILSHPNDKRSLKWYKDNAFISEEPSLSVVEEGLYELRFIGPCDSYSDFIVIKDEDVEDFIPNIFTPNHDDKNETFELSKSLAGSSVSIYNRWGIEVFESDDYQNNWNASDLPSGVYFYLIQSACSKTIFKGPITVMR